MNDIQKLQDSYPPDRVINYEKDNQPPTSQTIEKLKSIFEFYKNAAKEVNNNE